MIIHEFGKYKAKTGRGMRQWRVWGEADRDTSFVFLYILSGSQLLDEDCWERLLLLKPGTSYKDAQNLVSLIERFEPDPAREDEDQCDHFSKEDALNLAFSNPGLCKMWKEFIKDLKYQDLFSHPGNVLGMDESLLRRLHHALC